MDLLTYVSRVVFQEEPAKEPQPARAGGRRLHRTNGTKLSAGCTPQLRPGPGRAPYLLPGNEPLWMEIPCMQRKLSVWTQDREGPPEARLCSPWGHEGKPTSPPQPHAPSRTL